MKAAAPPEPLSHAVAAAISGHLAEKMICVFSSQQIVAVFGQWGAGYTHIYFPENNSWIRGADMSIGRVYPGVATYDDLIYVIGGFKPIVANLVKPSNDAEKYTPPGYMTESAAPPTWTAALPPLVAITAITIALIWRKNGQNIPKHTNKLK